MECGVSRAALSRLAIGFGRLLGTGGERAIPRQLDGW